MQIEQKNKPTVPGGSSSETENPYSRMSVTEPLRAIDAFPYYCPGARRGNVFVATWLLRPRPRSTSVLYASPTVTM